MKKGPMECSSATTRRAGSRARTARRDARAAVEGARRSRSSIPRPIGIQNEQRRAVGRAPLRSTAAWMARARLLWALGATVAARLLKRWPRTPGATRQVAADAETQDILVLCFQKWVLRCGVRRRCGWTAARLFSPSPIHNAGKLPVAGSATSSTRPPHPSFLFPKLFAIRFFFRLAFRKWVFLIKRPLHLSTLRAADAFANGTHRRDAASARWDRTASEIPAATSPATTAAETTRTRTGAPTRTTPTRDSRGHPWGEAPGTPTSPHARSVASATSRAGFPPRAIASAPPPRARGPRPR